VAPTRVSARCGAISAMQLSDFDYDLPPELIAQHPAALRSASRLLVVGSDRADDRAVDRVFTDLPDLLEPTDLLVFNDTRVLKARLLGRKGSGGRIEAMVERIVDTTQVLALIRASHAPKPGSCLIFETPAARAPTVDAPASAGAAVIARVISREGDLYQLAFDEPVAPLLERIGRLPLPPYIAHPAQPEDEARYQTVYASRPGAVAAPTAGLHFDAAILERLRARGIATAMLTLHVGSGTFLPVRSDDLALHRMHSERFEIPPATAQMVRQTRARGGRVIAVGTTSLRALEASGGHAGADETDIFITPGYRFQVVDALVTNFHLPRSTLLMLVSAFAGVDTIRRAYAHAIAERYRFFSYGDAMLLNRREAC
jgi:S-adenosylmethionine:tRNA ribosyltransferase-isomerase